MRAWIVLLFLPLAGCIGGPATVVGPFVFDAINRGDPAPVAVDDCASLLETLNERADLQARVRLDQSIHGHDYGPIMFDDMAVMESSMEGDAAAAPGGGGASPEVTGTNNQEAGADEADILKTDGTWTYVLERDQLIIMHSSGVGNLTDAGRVEIGGWGGQLLLDPQGPGRADDRLIVLTYGERPPLAASSNSDIRERSDYSMSRIQVYDLQSPANPRLVEQIWVEGDQVGARLVDGTVYVVFFTYERRLGLIDHVSRWQVMEEKGLDWEAWERLNPMVQERYLRDAALEAVEHNDAILANATLRDHIPIILESRGEIAVPQVLNDAACQRFLANPDGTGRGVSTILALDAGDLEHQTTQIVSDRPIIYGAPGALVLAASSQSDWWFWAQPNLDEATNLHWFDLDGLDVVHRASGRVDGIIQDQFGIDVHDGQLRVATTTGTWGRWWVEDPLPMMNHLVVFEEVAGALVQQGRVGGIAPEERIWSARFTDERAYIVTFEQIDPLWIIDLSDPRRPSILGELEIPGVSTYIHPLSDDALLTIGLGPREDGTGLDWGRIQVSLFDISDPSDPTRADLLDISPGGDGWTWSAAVHEHKAFTYWDSLGKLAVPVSSHHYGEVWDADGGEDGEGDWIYKEERHLGLRIIDVDAAGLDLSIYGDVDQNHMLQDGQGYPYGGLDVQRSFFLGFPNEFPQQPVSVYALSGLGMSAHDLETLEPQDHVSFGIEGGYYGEVVF